MRKDSKNDCKIASPRSKQQFPPSNDHMQLSQQIISQQLLLQDNDGQLVFPLPLPANEILDYFEDIALELGYKMIEKEDNYAIATKQYKNIESNLLGCLTNWWQGITCTAMKLTLVRSQSQQLKKIGILRGLVGIKKEINRFIEVFKTKIKITQNNEKSIITQYQDEQTKQEISNPYYFEACTIVMVSKAILNKENQISKIWKKYENEFEQEYKNKQKLIQFTSKMMKNIINIIYNINNKLLKQFKLSQKNKQLIPYLKISIEKFIFENLSLKLNNIYQLKNQSKNNILYQTKQQIFQSLTIEQIFIEIGLNKKIWCIDTNLLKQKLNCQQARKEIKFCLVCTELQKISFVSSPREKLRHCQIMYTELKTFFIDYFNKYEFNSMQDIIPIFILVILLCKIDHLGAHFDLMKDYINQNYLEMQTQKRLHIHLSQSYNYIIRDWKINKNIKQVK